MLVSKKPKLDGKIVAAKLVSGEEIMAKLVSSEDGCIRLNKPVSYIMGVNPDNPDQTEVLFSPWMVGVDLDTTVELDIKHILFMGQAGTDATDRYNEAMSDDQPIKESVTATANNSKSVRTPAPVASHRR
jgi:hypothetical protein